jgi:hypothetical protein
MTLTIVKGLAGKGQTQDVSSAKQSGKVTSQTNQAQIATTSSAATVVSSNGEAAVSNVRARTQAQGPEKIRDLRRAQSLAEGVAEEVLTSEASLNAHSLQDTAARHHLL